MRPLVKVMVRLCSLVRLFSPSRSLVRLHNLNISLSLSLILNLSLLVLLSLVVMFLRMLVKSGRRRRHLLRVDQHCSLILLMYIGLLVRMVLPQLLTGMVVSGFFPLILDFKLIRSVLRVEL